MPTPWLGVTMFLQGTGQLRACFNVEKVKKDPEEQHLTWDAGCCSLLPRLVRKH